ncbi:dihydroorotate dehydrogenase [Kineosphaera limosa NBRC 100340]|uniref:Dihydroorotate dehydrogenase n=1 Tax=Kineosphaera limosa NBRC 100340 TaxID=1184609 RepID=K6WAT9_9MICO|nr:dihydroorotate dehydrogenase [Kineosphaera limosa NBRC 100340]
MPPASGLGPASVPPLPRTLQPGGKVDLTTVLGPLSLPNPVMTASGCAANGVELHRFFDISTLGAFVTKTVLADPRSGRGTPRMAETPSGMLNSIGLQGPGIEAFVEKDLAWLMTNGARVIVSIAGNDPREFAQVAKTLVNSPAFDACVGVEINISCPNVANRGLVFACDPAATTEVIDRVRTQVPPGIPILVKLSPDVTDIVQIARAAVHAGADALTMINTTLGLEIDPVTLRPALAGITGGLSGPAIRPTALRAVWQVYAAMQAGVVPKRPIVGVGGIRTGRDALTFLAAGATAVQVGTAIFNDPHAPVRVRDELSEELRSRGVASPADVVGIAHQRVPGVTSLRSTPGRGGTGAGASGTPPPPGASATATAAGPAGAGGSGGPAIRARADDSRASGPATAAPGGRR